MAPHSTEVALSHIRALSLNLMKLTSPRSAKSHTSPRQEISIPSCTLPEPQPLRLCFDLGFDSGIAEKCSSVYLRAASQLKARCEKRLQHASQDFMRSGSSPFCDTMPLQSLHSEFVLWYVGRLNTLAEAIKARALRAIQTRADISNMPRHPRRGFSQHAISILENFFEHNAFPSRAQKHGLATETDMKYMQVHVWFQNRRRRRRKEGKELKRGNDMLQVPSEPETSAVKLLPLTELDERTSKLLAASADTLTQMAPCHAFPTAYPPICSYDPFPIERKYDTPWIRKSSSALTGRSRSIDIAQLATLFENMNLVDKTRMGTPCLPLQSRPALHHYHSDIIGFTTTPSHAPHPAFIPTAVIAPSMLRIKSMQPTSSRTPESVMSCLQTTASVTQAKNSMSRRKVASLPKRMPTSTSVAHRSMPLSVSHISPSSIPTSRSSSVASTMSSSPTVFASTSHSHAGASPSSVLRSTAQQSLSRRRVAALPKRASSRPLASCDPPPSPTCFVSVSSSRTTSTSSQTSSLSSSPSEPDTPLSTPPSLHILLPNIKMGALRTSEPASSFGYMFNEPSVGGPSPTEGLQLTL